MYTYNHALLTKLAHAIALNCARLTGTYAEKKIAAWLWIEEAKQCPETGEEREDGGAFELGYLWQRYVVGEGRCLQDQSAPVLTRAIVDHTARRREHAAVQDQVSREAQRETLNAQLWQLQQQLYEQSGGRTRYPSTEVVYSALQLPYDVQTASRHRFEDKELAASYLEDTRRRPKKRVGGARVTCDTVRGRYTTP